jgi:hypothetical protein
VASEEDVAGAAEEDSKVEATKDERSRRREARSLEDIYPLCVFFDIWLREREVTNGLRVTGVCGYKIRQSTSKVLRATGPF